MQRSLRILPSQCCIILKWFQFAKFAVQKYVRGWFTEKNARVKSRPSLCNFNATYMNGRFSSRFNIKFTSHFTVYFVIGGTASHCMVQIRFMNKSMRVAGICSSVHDWRFPVLNFIMFMLVDKLGASANSHVFHCKVTLQAIDAGNKSSMHVHGIIMSLY
mgnify:FL=1